MTDLDRLIAAVEAGSSPTLSELGAVTPSQAFSQEMSDAADAFKGSLEAAHRLHEALLPGWGWTPECADAAEVWPLGKLTLAIRPYSDGVTPARAWLLAILRALREKEKGQ